MDRYFKIIIILVTIIISAAFSPTALQAEDLKNDKQITTHKQAAIHAARLANEKCQKEFGCSPFKPESYKAEFEDSNWRWGKICPPGIHGYSAKVEFRKDGSSEDVKVVLHTDALDRRYRIQSNEKEKIIIKKEDIKIEIP